MTRATAVLEIPEQANVWNAAGSVGIRDQGADAVRDLVETAFVHHGIRIGARSVQRYQYRHRSADVGWPMQEEPTAVAGGRQLMKGRAERRVRVERSRPHESRTPGEHQCGAGNGKRYRDPHSIKLVYSGPIGRRSRHKESFSRLQFLFLS